MRLFVRYSCDLILTADSVRWILKARGRGGMSVCSVGMSHIMAEQFLHLPFLDRLGAYFSNNLDVLKEIMLNLAVRISQPPFPLTYHDIYCSLLLLRLQERWLEPWHKASIYMYMTKQGRHKHFDMLRCKLIYVMYYLLHNCPALVSLGHHQHLTFPLRRTAFLSRQGCFVLLQARREVRPLPY